MIPRGAGGGGIVAKDGHLAGAGLAEDRGAAESLLRHGQELGRQGLAVEEGLPLPDQRSQWRAVGGLEIPVAVEGGEGPGAAGLDEPAEEGAGVGVGAGGRLRPEAGRAEDAREVGGEAECTQGPSLLVDGKATPGP